MFIENIAFPSGIQYTVIAALEEVGKYFFEKSSIVAIALSDELVGQFFVIGAYAQVIHLYIKFVAKVLEFIISIVFLNGVCQNIYAFFSNISYPLQGYAYNFETVFRNVIFQKTKHAYYEYYSSFF